MVKRLRAVCGFFLLLALLLALLSWYFTPKDNTPEAGIQDYTASGFLAEEPDSLDYVILGDSVPLCAFSPEIIGETGGIPGYVCATTGQNLLKSERFLRDFLENQSPRVVILEANHLYRAFSLLDQGVSRLEDLIPLLRYHDGWKFLKPGQALSSVRYTCRIPERGYYEKEGVSPAPEGEYMIPGNGITPIPEASRRVLARIQALCAQNGAELLLLSAPSAANWDYCSHNGTKAVARELGIAYVDMNLEDTAIDWSLDTVDEGDHLNGSGARKASVWLAEYLSRQ